MPQLDVGTYASQLFWLSACFFALLFISWRVTLPRLARILDARWEKIEGAREQAHKWRQESDALAALYEAQLAEAKARSHAEIARVNRELSQTIAGKKSEIKMKLKDKYLSAEVRIMDKKAAAMGEVQGIAQAVAHDLVSKMLHVPPTLSVEDAVATTLQKRASNGF